MRRLKRFKSALVFVQCLLVLTVVIFASETTPAQEPAAPSLVKLSLIATDKNDRAIDDIRLEDLSISEGGTIQTITSFSKDVRPVDYCLLLDSSASFKNLLKQTLEMGQLILQSNWPTDEACAISFSSSEEIAVLQDFTSNRATLIDSLDATIIRPGQSAVVDAVYMGAKHVAERAKKFPNRRRALVLISDGEDRASYYSEKELFKVLRELDVQIFAIGVTHLLSNDPLGVTRRNPKEKAEEFLTRLAEETGGRVFLVRTNKELSHATEQIIHDLHMQYTIGYVPVNAGGEKGFREVKVRLTNSPGGDKRIAITRRGYSLKGEKAVDKKSEKKSDKKSP